MQSFLLLLFQFFAFWFVEAPKGMIIYFISLNQALLKFFSFTVLLKTFFKPWKNEYREGLVGFSIFMGIVMKSMLIFFDLILIIMFVIAEITIILLFICWPIITITLPFI